MRVLPFFPSIKGLTLDSTKRLQSNICHSLTTLTHITESHKRYPLLQTPQSVVLRTVCSMGGPEIRRVHAKRQIISTSIQPNPVINLTSHAKQRPRLRHTGYSLSHHNSTYALSTSQYTLHYRVFRLSTIYRGYYGTSTFHHSPFTESDILCHKVETSECERWDRQTYRGVSKERETRPGRKGRKKGTVALENEH